MPGTVLDVWDVPVNKPNIPHPHEAYTSEGKKDNSIGSHQVMWLLCAPWKRRIRGVSNLALKELVKTFYRDSEVEIWEINKK